jgi:hypothetical protein
MLIGEIGQVDTIQFLATKRVHPLMMARRQGKNTIFIAIYFGCGGSYVAMPCTRRIFSWEG